MDGFLQDVRSYLNFQRLLSAFFRRTNDYYFIQSWPWSWLKTSQNYCKCLVTCKFFCQEPGIPGPSTIEFPNWISSLRFTLYLWFRDPSDEMRTFQETNFCLLQVFANSLFLFLLHKHSYDSYVSKKFSPSYLNIKITRMNQKMPNFFLKFSIAHRLGFSGSRGFGHHSNFNWRQILYRSGHCLRKSCDCQNFPAT